ncbi:MAG: hypothetical protein M1282_13315 [Chloroflexi bacterium]|nr:hypothetical protein [Chloroflexota bacterium]
MKYLLVILTALAIASAACSPSSISRPPAFIAPQNYATPVINATSYPTVQAPQANSSQSVSGFAVNLQRAWRDGKQVYADVCYTLPDSSDWIIWNAQLSYADQNITQFSISMLSKQDATNGQPGQRCDELTFYVPPDANLSSASLIVQSLGAQPTQDEYCSLLLPKIQEALNQRGIAITLGCSDVNGAMTMQIVSKPASMSDQEADQIVYSDEFFTIRGPWTFPLNLGQ